MYGFITKCAHGNMIILPCPDSAWVPFRGRKGGENYPYGGINDCWTIHWLFDDAWWFGPDWDLIWREFPAKCSFVSRWLDEECAPPGCLTVPTSWQVRLSTLVSESLHRTRVHLAVKMFAKDIPPIVSFHRRLFSDSLVMTQEDCYRSVTQSHPHTSITLRSVTQSHPHN